MSMEKMTAPETASNETEKLAAMKGKLQEWLSADGDMEEIPRRREVLENKRAQLTEHYGSKARNYLTFYLLSGDSLPDTAAAFDFPPNDSVQAWLDNLTV